MHDMSSAGDQGAILVTGACGHIGRELCRLLRHAKRKILPVDLDQDKTAGVMTCDLRSKREISLLFQIHPIRVVIHLAAILPSAFWSDPLTGVDVNMGGSCELMRQSVAAHIKRVIFASSMSVYGSSATSRALTEDDSAAPDEPYGAGKRAVELIGEALAKEGRFEFVALRIARVVGRGIKKTSSPWRSQIFETRPQADWVSVPFAPEAVLSLVHVEEVARMLLTLAETPEMSSFIYNTPVEIWQARQLKQAVEELRGIHVELGTQFAHGGPVCDGGRFEREFGFELRGLRDHLSACTRSNPALL
jgi:nucleoside-diphosphate-sugar epimerase